MLVLRASGFWSLTVGFLVLLASYGSPIPPSPGQPIPSFASQSLQEAPPLGQAEGEIWVELFDRFGCADCDALAAGTMSQLRKATEPMGEVRIKLRPLSDSDEGEPYEGAKAMVCAAEQGKAWEMYEALHALEEAITPESAMAQALELELDSLQMEACLASPGTQQSLAQVRQHAQQQGIGSSPTLIIGRRRLLGLQPIENLLHAIVLASKEAKNMKSESPSPS